MRKKHLIGLAAVGGLAAWYFADGGVTGRSGLEFSRPALPPDAKIDIRPTVSAAYVSVPIDVGPVARRAEEIFGDKPVTVQEVLGNIACGKRGNVSDCNDARIEGSIERSGPIEWQTTATSARVVIHVKYQLSATGIGWASQISEQKSGEAKIAIPFAIVNSPSGALDVALRDEPPSPESQVPLLKATLKLNRLLDQRLKPLAKSIEDDLRKRFAQAPIRTALSKAWGALSQPLELGKGSGLWLKSAPEHYAAGSLIAEGGQLSYRMPIASRLAIAEGERVGAAPKRQPMPGTEIGQAQPALVRMAIPISLQPLRTAVEAHYARVGVIESKADRFSEPVKVTVGATRIYPAQRQIGIELAVDVTNAKGARFSGKVHLAGRPVLDPATGTVTLADITFPAIAARDASPSSGLPRLNPEAIAAGVGAVARLDVSAVMAEALPRAKHLLNLRAADDLALVTELSSVEPVSFELVKDGAILLVDLKGDVAFVYDGPAEQDQAGGPMIPAADQTAGMKLGVATTIGGAAAVSSVKARTQLQPQPQVQPGPQPAPQAHRETAQKRPVPARHTSRPQSVKVDTPKGGSFSNVYQ